MINLFQVILVFILIVFFTGCGTYPTVEYPKRLNKTKIKEFKNYSLNKKSLAFVGQPLFRIKNKQLIQHEVIAVEPESDFKVKFRGQEYFVNSKVSYRVNALLSSYKLINFDTDRELTFSYQDNYMVLDINNNLVDKVWTDGQMHDAYFSKIPKMKVSSLKIFLPDYMVEGSLNIELIYNGRNKDGIKLLYREYTSSNLARPAFYQNLIYGTDEEHIRFKNFLIKIHTSNNQEIVYTILRDDFKEDTILIE